MSESITKDIETIMTEINQLSIDELISNIFLINEGGLISNDKGRSNLREIFLMYLAYKLKDAGYLK